MRTVVSIPDDVLKKAERLAARSRKSRSQLLSDAVKEYVARHAPEEVTDAMDRVCAELDEDRDDSCRWRRAAGSRKSSGDFRKATFGELIWRFRQVRVRATGDR